MSEPIDFKSLLLTFYFSFMKWWLSNYFQDSLIHNEQIIFPDFQKEN